MTPRLVGMVHLAPLPGAPGFDGDLDAVVAAAVTDARTLAAAGFDAVLVENFGDAPFFADDVPKVTIAAMTVAVGAVRDAVDVAVGVNVLRNDAFGALAVAAASGASFIRVNVLAGTMFTDQGPITGRAAELGRARKALAPEVAVWADVFVKHAVPPPGLRIAEATHDLAARSGADAIVVSGSATGSPPAPKLAAEVREAAGGLPVLIGSGVTAATVADFLAVADGVIVGTSLKRGGDPREPIGADAARRLVEAAA